MRSLSYRPRKEDSKKEEIQEVVPETQPVQVESEASTGFDESIVINWYRLRSYLNGAPAPFQQVAQLPPRYEYRRSR